jgi:hypothetical protein
VFEQVEDDVSGSLPPEERQDAPRPRVGVGRIVVSPTVVRLPDDRVVGVDESAQVVLNLSGARSSRRTRPLKWTPGCSTTYVRVRTRVGSVIGAASRGSWNVLRRPGVIHRADDARGHERVEAVLDEVV